MRLPGPLLAAVAGLFLGLLEAPLPAPVAPFLPWGDSRRAGKLVEDLAFCCRKIRYK